jgi:hypothetical protein
MGHSVKRPKSVSGVSEVEKWAWSWGNIVRGCLQMGIHSERGVTRWFCHCVNIIECTCVSQISVTLINEKVYFGSWLWSFQSIIDWIHCFCAEAAHLSRSTWQAKLLISWLGSERERKGQGSKIPFKGTLSVTWMTPTRSHILKAPSRITT